MAGHALVFWGVAEPVSLTILPEAGDRVSDGLLAFYAFSTGSGDTVYDLSGSTAPLHLRIDNPDRVRWLAGGGLAVENPARLEAIDGGEGLYNAFSASGQLTVEAWVRPANLSQSGPARIVTLSGGSSIRNFTLGQSASEYRARLRTTDSNVNGQPEASHASAATTLQHVVMSFDASATLHLYVDGVLVDSVARAGDFSNWEAGFGFALANELGASRPWLGDLHLVALYDRALDDAEILQNFVAGGGADPGSGEDTPPLITSTAVESATTDASYRYQVTATGSPAPGFSLSGAPGDMSIDPDSGLIFWQTPLAGSYPLTVTVSNTAGSDQQSYTLSISEPVEPPPAGDGLIIDDGDPGTYPIGTWLPSSGADPYGSGSLYSDQAGDRYRFEATTSGTFQVYLWWTEYRNRSDAVSVEILDGTRLLDRVVVNQQQNGGTWNLLSGSGGPDYTFVEQPRIVVIASGGATTSADAVQLVSVTPGGPQITSTPPTLATLGQPYTYPVSASGEDLSYALEQAPSGMAIDPLSGEVSWTPGAVGEYPVSIQVSNSLGSDTQSYALRVDDPAAALVLDNGDPGTTALGDWRISGASGAYGADSVFSKRLGESYRFEQALSGEYEVWVWWTEYSNRADQVPIEIHHASGAVTTVFVNQRSNGGQWNRLGGGSFSFDGLGRVEIVVPAGGASTSADAVKFQQVGTP